jgi:cation diffusion facilitator CzcD-associated flavoprotein CzcO
MDLVRLDVEVGVGTAETRDTDILVIGGGFAGLGMAIELKRSGRHDFVLLEKAEDVGGTWRDNTYPGCACDIRSHLYSFSFELNPGWSRMFATQPEIWAYLRRVTDKYGLRRHIRFGVEVTGAHWDERRRVWRVRTRAGDTYTARAVVSGVGALHVPNVPKLPGAERFRGTTFHSATWDHDYDLRGKRVAVIGTGASAIQFVPEIARHVAELSVFQRTPPWIVPKTDRPVRPWEQRMFRLLPFTQRVYRNAIYWLLESRALGFTVHPRLMWLAQLTARKHLEKQVADPELRARLTPSYTMGCKRVLISNDYYPTLARANVHLVTEAVTEITENGVLDAAGTAHEVDAIVYGTGFHVTDGYDHLDIVGRDGRNLVRQWHTEGMETYLGIAVSGFPNLFFLLGPNTALGHNSVVFMIESQIHYIGQCLRSMAEHGADAMDVRPRAQRTFYRHLQRRLTQGVWTQGGCDSWYLDAHGANRTIWPGFTWRYWQRTRKVRLADFELFPAGRREPDQEMVGSAG